jgi:hypothetical protein
MFVTSMQHTLGPDGWTARIGLDTSLPWRSPGGRWAASEPATGDDARWSDAGHPYTTWAVPA